MELNTAHELRDRYGKLIAELYDRLEDRRALPALEKALRLWSELDAASGAAAVEDEKAKLLSETVGAEELLSDLTAPSQTPVFYSRLPAPRQQRALFGEDGLIAPAVREAGLDTLKKRRTAFVLLAGGAGTRYVDSARSLKEALKNDTPNAEQKQALDGFARVGMDVDDCLNQGKLFAPISSVRHKGPFVINMESIAEVLSLTHDDVPVVVFVSDTTREDVCRLIHENNGFGLKHLAVADQDMAPFVREDGGGLLENGRGANGGGGIIYSLGHARPVSADGEALFDGSMMDWFASLGVEHVVFSQTDDAKRSDIYLGLSGTAGAEDGMVLTAACYLYPALIQDGKPSFKLGSFWSDGDNALCITEFADLKPEQIGLLTALDHPDGRAVANAGLYLMDCALIQRVIDEGLLGIHMQRHKKEADADGTVRAVTKFEYFLPDLPGIASKLGARCRIALLRDTSSLDEPLRNLTVDALPAKDICKLALCQQARLYCDTLIARAAGLTVEEGALVEIGPFAEIEVEGSAVIEKGAKLYIGGTAAHPVRVTFEDGARVRGLLVLTESADIRADRD